MVNIKVFLRLRIIKPILCISILIASISIGHYYWPGMKRDISMLRDE